MPGEGPVPPRAAEEPAGPQTQTPRGWVGMVLGTTAAGCCGAPALPGGTHAGAGRGMGRDNVRAEQGLLSKAEGGSCAYGGAWFF